MHPCEKVEIESVSESRGKNRTRKEKSASVTNEKTSENEERDENERERQRSQSNKTNSTGTTNKRKRTLMKKKRVEKAIHIDSERIYIIRPSMLLFLYVIILHSEDLNVIYCERSTAGKCSRKEWPFVTSSDGCICAWATRAANHLSRCV